MVTGFKSAKASSAVLDALCSCVHELGARGWLPADSGNFSVRLPDGGILISKTGCDKPGLRPGDLIAVDALGRGLDQDMAPSAETLLHLQLYDCFADAGCVLHTHSLTQTVASLQYAPDGAVHLQGYELLKALDGFASHDDALIVPVAPNSQYMPDIAVALEPVLNAASRGYLIEGHGLYTWGSDVGNAKRHLEAIDFMLACELARSRHS